jgi:hypothetical protein
MLRRPEYSKNVVVVPKEEDIDMEIYRVNTKTLLDFK